MSNKFQMKSIKKASMYLEAFFIAHLLVAY